MKGEGGFTSPSVTWRQTQLHLQTSFSFSQIDWDLFVAVPAVASDDDEEEVWGFLDEGPCDWLEADDKEEPIAIDNVSNTIV